MRVGGVENVRDVVYGPLVFSRGRDSAGEEILLAFYAKPVWDLNEFDEQCPLPECEQYQFTKDGKKKDYDHPVYKDQLAEHDKKRWGYYTLKSLQPSDLELETASLDDPETWGNVESELRSELNLYEFAKLMRLVDEANSLDTRKLDANMETFLQRRAQRTEENTQHGEAENISSLEPA